MKLDIANGTSDVECWTREVVKSHIQAAGGPADVDLTGLISPAYDYEYFDLDVIKQKGIDSLLQQDGMQTSRPLPVLSRIHLLVTGYLATCKPIPDSLVADIRRFSDSAAANGDMETWVALQEILFLT